MGVKSRTGSVSDKQIVVEQVLREKLPARLVAEREARGWTQEALAERAGVHWTTIGKIERGRQLPSVALLVLLTKALEVDVGSLLSLVLQEDESHHEDDPCLQLLHEMPSGDRESIYPVLEALVRWKRG